ncbi:DUF7059 domain-containing protein [Allonocardiopsis opalescens]|uniref:DUF7059 domain-containing protein n=1 Tax=Allonocardiopsis opalescens TaxID=1144618 RepID=UPI001B807A7B|nr:methyltransferase [Allonocardiopsis opalescens]
MLLEPAAVERLRTALTGTGYTVAGVRELLGPVAGAALAREQVVPALRATADGGPLAELVRLWWLQVPVECARLEPLLPVPELIAAGLLRDAGTGERSAPLVRAAVGIRPWETDAAEVYLVADLAARPGDPPPGPDHVVRAGSASAGLAALTVRTPVGRALDLGTGCGVQALQLAEHCAEVVATDSNPRALRLAELSFALSGRSGVDLRAGSLFEPVAGEEFDLIAANPPFVISPGGARLAYRENAYEGDGLIAELVRSAPRHLAPGGWCQLLANWLHVDGEDWTERVAGWATASGCDAWVVQRDVQDPAEYVELWLGDSVEPPGPERTRRYDAWLDWFERQKVAGIGYGWIVLRASGSDRPEVRVEELPQQVEQPVGRYLPELFDGFAAARALDDERLLRTALALAPGVVQEQTGPPGADDPERIVLRQTGRLGRAAQVGTVEAALAGVCDGTIPLEPLLAAIAELTGADPAEVARRTPPVLRALIADGFLTVPV